MGRDGGEEVEIVLVKRAVGGTVQDLDGPDDLVAGLEGDTEGGLGGEAGMVVDPLVEPVILADVRDDEREAVLEDKDPS